MELEEHKEKFQQIIKKYGFSDEIKAQEITDFLLSNNQGVSLDEFSKRFSIPKDEAKVFLSFIVKGIEFKEEVIDKNNNEN